MKKSIDGLQIMGWIFSAPQAGKSKADTVSFMIFLNDFITFIYANILIYFSYFSSTLPSSRHGFQKGFMEVPMQEMKKKSMLASLLQEVQQMCIHYLEPFKRTKVTKTKTSKTSDSTTLFTLNLMA